MPNGRWSPFQRQQQWSCRGMNFGHCLGNQLPCSSFQIKTQTLLSSGFMLRWKRFAMDNKLEIGDACVFELLDYSTKCPETVV
ncbi:hypothetical protein Patl1_23654 [Pistacia atlantica]|uniref:Uncharacterized protein n=1 Tax=Pistacia atlantica TaxID=434234 RepID=A0ACC1A2L5_9ROSI|nr:hypothetical protein Patl1_23654 [Pistacia atlantica]